MMLLRIIEDREQEEEGGGGGEGERERELIPDFGSLGQYITVLVGGPIGRRVGNETTA